MVAKKLKTAFARPQHLKLGGSAATIPSSAMPQIQG